MQKNSIVGEEILNSLFIFVLSAILLGAFFIQIFQNESPCSLCLLQRIGMLGMAASAFMNIVYGPKPFHYGGILLFAILGGFIALRQIALHVCPDHPVFGKPFWGISLYTWSFFISASSVAFVALMLLIFKGVGKANRLHPFWKVSTFTLLFLITLANAIYTLFACGLGPCE